MPSDHTKRSDRHPTVLRSQLRDQPWQEILPAFPVLLVRHTAWQDRGMHTTRRTDGRPQARSTPFPVLMVIVLAVAALAACASAQTPALTATRQVHVSPVDADGTPVGGFRATTTVSHAGCEPGSEAIGQAYRCFAGNFLYDPCWAVRAAVPTVLCLAYPWSVTAIRLEVDAPLGAIPAAVASEPWGVELANGQRCELLQGAHSLFDGRVIDYYCDSRLSLLRGLTTSSAVWRATSVTVTGGKQALGPSEQIKIAWFGVPDAFR